MSKSPDAFRTISEVADWLGVQAHVLRFWESKFSQVKPVKRAGGRRYYRPSDMQLLGGIKNLLHDDGITIKGVQKILREQGVGHVSGLSQTLEDTGETSSSKPPEENIVLRFRASPKGTDDVEDATLLDDDDDGNDDEVPETPVQFPSPAPTPKIAAEATPTPPDDSALTPPLADPKFTPESDDPAPDAEPVGSETPKVPLFMRRSAQNRTTSAETMSTPVRTLPPTQPRARVVDAPDPPADSDLPYLPGVLAHLAKLDHLTPQQAQLIAPVARDLQDWLGRNSGTDTA